jgi:hypothetical protein
MDVNMPEDLQILDFFKALADASRLKIIGVLAQHPCSVEELSSLLELKPPTISHHLEKLSAVGLVSAQARGWYSIYSLERSALDAAARKFLSTDNLATSTRPDLDVYDRKVLSDFSTPDGRLEVIPAKRKKLEAVLHNMVRSFEPGRRYTEKQVNEILFEFNEDTATLRRELVGYGLLKREGGGRVYWRNED